MSGKIRHKRGKHTVQSKRKVDRSSRPSTPPQQPAVAQIKKSVSSTEEPLPAASVPATTAKPQVVRYPYISAELRTIGILAVVMLAILVVLALVPLPF